MDRKTRPSRPVSRSQPCVQSMFLRLAVIIASPQTKLESSERKRFDRDQIAIEQLVGDRPAVGRVDQRRVGREQRREQHHVGQDEQPEAVGDDDALRFRPAMAKAGVFRALVGQADGRCFAAASYGLAQFVEMFHADAAALAGIRP